MADFRAAILITIDPDHEGGFQNNPKDRANWSSGIIGVGKLIGTKYGITALDMPGVDIEHLTVDEAVAYYSKNYWKQGYSQIDSQPLANKLFDMGVLFGVGSAVKTLQFALDITIDGNFGPHTLAATNAAMAVPHPTLLSDFKKRLKVHAEQILAEHPSDAEFIAGWERRVDS